MDKNKLDKLKEIKYRILQTCASCKQGNFQSDEWGTCNKHTYTHLKHSDKVRQLSIHISGNCPDFEWREDILAKLHGFKELL